MRPRDFLEFLGERPYAPFRIHVTAGRIYDVRHLDHALVLSSRAILPLPASSNDAFTCR
jgi:hypothetical protein